MADDAFENAVVIWSRGGGDLILRRFGGSGLEQFLKFALRIFQNREVIQFSKRPAEFAQNEFARGFITSVEKQRANERLERIGERRGTLASAVKLLAAAENEMRTEINHATVDGQRTAVDEFGAGFRERPFFVFGKFFVKLAGQHELQYRVTEKFQALVVLKGLVLFVGDRRMRERETQERIIVEGVAEALLEGGEVGHGKSVGDRMLGV